MYTKASKRPFAEIAQEKCLKETAIEALIAEDVDAVTVLSTLKEDDIVKFKLSIGQHELLSAWLVKLQDKANKAKDTDSAIKPPGWMVTGDNVAQNATLNAEVNAHLEESGLGTTDTSKSDSSTKVTGMAAVAIINRGSCKQPMVMACLRRIFWLSAVFNFRLRAVYYPGVRNVPADAASRLHEPRGAPRLLSLLASMPHQNQQCVKSPPPPLLPCGSRRQATLTPGCFTEGDAFFLSTNVCL